MPRTFEESVHRVELIIRDLASDAKPLSDAVALFEEAMSCLRDASTQLHGIETQVRMLIEESNGATADRVL